MTRFSVGMLERWNVAAVLLALVLSNIPTVQLSAQSFEQRLLAVPDTASVRQMSRDLGRSANPKWYDMSARIEQYIKNEKHLNANVDFYSASTYTTLGLDVDLFTPVFAVSRISGWAAHVIEQLDDNRLIRPRAEYTGPEYPVKYVPMEQR